MIVTFPCTAGVIHIYEKTSHLTPLGPLKLHETIDSAKEYLKNKGIHKISLTVYK